MDRFSLHFSSTAPHSSVEGLGKALKINAIAELEAEVQAMERPYYAGGETSSAPPESGAVLGRVDLVSPMPTHQRLLERRSAFGLLEVTILQQDQALQVNLAPARVAQALYAIGPDWMAAFLQRHLQESTGLELTFQRFEGHDSSPESPRDSKTISLPPPTSRSTWIRRVGALLMFIPLLMTGIILFFLYTWMNEVRNDYQDLQSTVDVQKEQILEAVERGVKSSTDVMDLIDLARDWTQEKDSIQK